MWLDKLSSGDRTSTQHLNRLRAAVLGANDGIVSISSLILGVAGATDKRGAILTAGLAGLVAGAFSMGLGEYVSVSSQRDSERAYIAVEKRRLVEHPAEEFEELTEAYRQKGLSDKTARIVARELTDNDAVKAHLDAELNLSEDDLNNPVQAAAASLLAFSLGGVIPLLAMLLASRSARVAIIIAAVVVALFFTGFLSATAGRASRRRAVARVLIGGVLAMIVTYYVGHLFGANV